MIFKRSMQRYGRTPQPETPYQRAGQLWDERIGSARVQARNWRLMAFGALALAGGSSAALVWQAQQSRVVPYVVAVDRLGEARAVTAAEAAYQPTDPQIAWHLARFVQSIRTVSLDPVLMRAAWLTAYDFVTPRGGQYLATYARDANPFAGLGDRTVSVQVTSVVRASDRAFQVKWTESSYVRGTLAGTTRWTAILTVVVQPPKSLDTLRRNPLGLYVDAIDWSRELEPPSPAMPPSAASPPPSPGAATSPAPALQPQSTSPEVQP